MWGQGLFQGLILYIFCFSPVVQIFFYLLKNVQNKEKLNNYPFLRRSIFSSSLLVYFSKCVHSLSTGYFTSLRKYERDERYIFKCLIYFVPIVLDKQTYFSECKVAMPETNSLFIKVNYIFTISISMFFSSI